MSTEDVVMAYLFALLISGMLGYVGIAMISYNTIDAFKKHTIGHEYKWYKPLGFTFAGFVLIALSITGVNYTMSWEPPPPIKLIILDIDGVLNHNKAPERINVSHLYDPACIGRFNKLVKAHRAKIVVCSAWRIGHDIVGMQEVLDSIGVRGEVIGLTPYYQGYHTRDDEITAWLSHYDDFGNIEGIVLLDDDSSDRFKSIQVKPSWESNGLLDEHIKEAHKILSAGLPENFDIGKVEVCESKVNKEMSFGGHFIQKKQSGL
jgi:hypothetical protein